MSPRTSFDHNCIYLKTLMTITHIHKCDSVVLSPCLWPLMHESALWGIPLADGQCSWFSLRSLVPLLHTLSHKHCKLKKVAFILWVWRKGGLPLCPLTGFSCSTNANILFHILITKIPIWLNTFQVCKYSQDFIEYEHCGVWKWPQLQTLPNVPPSSQKL